MRYWCCLLISAILSNPTSTFASYIPPHTPTILPNHITPPGPLGRVYNNTCFDITEPAQPDLNPNRCSGILQVCIDLQRSAHYNPPINQWIWRDRHGCALEWFLPSVEASSDARDCPSAFYALIEHCAHDPRFTSGGANVLTMPGLESDGVAINASGARFAFAPTVLTGW